MNIQELNREGRGLLAALSETQGGLTSHKQTCLRITPDVLGTKQEASAIPYDSDVQGLMAAAVGLHSLLAGGNEEAQAAAAAAASAAELGERLPFLQERLCTALHVAALAAHALGMATQDVEQANRMAVTNLQAYLDGLGAE